MYCGGDTSIDGRPRAGTPPLDVAEYGGGECLPEGEINYTPGENGSCAAGTTGESNYSEIEEYKTLAGEASRNKDGARRRYYLSRILLREGNVEQARLMMLDFKDATEEATDPEIQAMREEVLLELRDFALEDLRRLEGANQSLTAQRESHIATKAYSAEGGRDNQAILSWLGKFIRDGRAYTLEEAMTLMQSEHTRLIADFLKNPVVKKGWIAPLSSAMRRQSAAQRLDMRRVQSQYLAAYGKDANTKAPTGIPAIRLMGGTLELGNNTSSVARVEIGREGGYVKISDREFYYFPPARPGDTRIVAIEGDRVHTFGLMEGKDFFRNEQDGRLEIGATRSDYEGGHPQTFLGLLGKYGQWENMGVRDGDFLALYNLRTRDGLQKMASPESRRKELLKAAEQVRHMGGSYEVARPILDELFSGYLEMAVREIPQSEIDTMIADAGADEAQRRIKKRAFATLDSWHKDGTLAKADPEADRAWGIYEDMFDPLDKTGNLSDTSLDAIVDEIIISALTMPVAMGAGAVVRSAVGASSLAMRLAAQGGAGMWAARGATLAAGSVAEGALIEGGGAFVSSRDLNLGSAGHAMFMSAVFHTSGHAWGRAANGLGIGERAIEDAVRMGAPLSARGLQAANTVGALITQTAVATGLSYAREPDAQMTFAERAGAELLRMVAFHYGMSAVNRPTGNFFGKMDQATWRGLRTAREAGNQNDAAGQKLQTEVKPNEPAVAQEAISESPEPVMLPPIEAALPGDNAGTLNVTARLKPVVRVQGDSADEPVTGEEATVPRTPVQIVPLDSPEQRAALKREPTKPGVANNTKPYERAPAAKQAADAADPFGRTAFRRENFSRFLDIHSVEWDANAFIDYYRGNPERIAALEARAAEAGEPGNKARVFREGLLRLESLMAEFNRLENDCHRTRNPEAKREMDRLLKEEIGPLTKSLKDSMYNRSELAHSENARVFEAALNPLEAALVSAEIAARRATGGDPISHRIKFLRPEEIVRRAGAESARAELGDEVRIDVEAATLEDAMRVRRAMEETGLTVEHNHDMPGIEASITARKELAVILPRGPRVTVNIDIKPERAVCVEPQEEVILESVDASPAQPPAEVEPVITLAREILSVDIVRGVLPAEIQSRMNSGKEVRLAQGRCFRYADDAFQYVPSDESGLAGFLTGGNNNLGNIIRSGAKGKGESARTIHVLYESVAKEDVAAASEFAKTQGVTLNIHDLYTGMMHTISPDAAISQSPLPIREELKHRKIDVMVEGDRARIDAHRTDKTWKPERAIADLFAAVNMAKAQGAKEIRIEGQFEPSEELLRSLDNCGPAIEFGYTDSNGKIHIWRSGGRRATGSSEAGGVLPDSSKQAAKVVTISDGSDDVVALHMDRISQERAREINDFIDGRDTTALTAQEQKYLIEHLVTQKGWSKQETQDLIGVDGMRRYMGYGADLPFGFESREQFESVREAILFELARTGKAVFGRIFAMGSSVRGYKYLEGKVDGGKRVVKEFNWERRPELGGKAGERSDIDVIVEVETDGFAELLVERVQSDMRRRGNNANMATAALATQKWLDMLTANSGGGLDAERASAIARTADLLRGPMERMTRGALESSIDTKGRDGLEWWQVSKEGRISDTEASQSLQTALARREFLTRDVGTDLMDASWRVASRALDLGFDRKISLGYKLKGDSDFLPPSEIMLLGGAIYSSNPEPIQAP